MFNYLKKRAMNNLILRKFIAWHAFYRLVTRDLAAPINFNYICRLYYFSDYNKQWRANLVEQVLADKACQEVVKDRTVLKRYDDREYLRTLPQTTLGFLYAKHLTDNEIIPIVPLNTKCNNDFHYIMHRFVMHHDLYHIVLGQDISLRGEAYISGFTVAQFPAYTQTSFHLVTTIFRGAAVELFDMKEIYQAVAQGFEAGEKAKPFFPVDWDSLVELTVDEVREKVNVSRVE